MTRLFQLEDTTSGDKYEVDGTFPIEVTPPDVPAGTYHVRALSDRAPTVLVVEEIIIPYHIALRGVAANFTPSTVGTAVQTWADTSDNSNDATQATAAARPIFRESGALDYLEFDGLDDRMTIAASASWRSGSASLIMVARIDSTELGSAAAVLAGSSNATGSTTYVALLESGSTSTSIGRGNARYANGTLISGNTRGDLYTAWVQDDWVVIEVAGIDFSSENFDVGLQLVGWRTDSNLFKIDLGEVLILPTADANSNRAYIVSALAAKWGITI